MKDNKTKILQNLKDAKCNSHIIKEFFRLNENGKVSEQLKLLSAHKKNLLKELHKNQRQIDCLDYLIFNLEQKR